MTDINGVVTGDSVQGKVHSTEVKVSIIGSGPKGKDGTSGKGLEYTWRGTELGVRIVGEPEFTFSDLSPDIDSDNYYVHDQIATSKDWTIQHNMGKYPSVTVVDSGGTVVIGEIEYVSVNQIVLHFTAEFSGKAYLN